MKHSKNKIDIQDLVKSKVRYDIEIDLHIGGYVEGGVPEMKSLAKISWKSLTTEEAEALIQTIAALTDSEE